MKTVQKALFVAFFILYVLARQLPVETRIAACPNPPYCAPGASTAEWRCAWELDPEGTPKNCSEAYEICTSFCSDKGNLNTSSFNCPTGVGQFGNCKCNNSYSCPCDAQCQCETYGSGVWLVPYPGAEGSCQPSPILLPLGNGGPRYELTSTADGVLFDIFGRGLRDQVSWTPANTSDGFLALDRNNNGVIDDGSELFGTATRLQDGSRGRNGFEVLSDLDGATGPRNGRIDSGDSVYLRSRIWSDRNHNGISEANEFTTLPEANILAIETEFREIRRQDANGNFYRYQGRAIVSNKNGGAVPRVVYDVILRVSPPVTF